MVLHWNPARDFYAAMGSVPMDEWIVYRMSGAALAKLGEPAGDGTHRPRTVG